MPKEGSFRIHHRTARSMTLLVPTRQTLGRTGTPKKFRLPVDTNGDAVVCESTWTLLKQAGLDGQFLVMNEIAKPPAQTLALGAHGQPQPTGELVGEALRQIAPQATNVTFTRPDTIPQNVRIR